MELNPLTYALLAEDAYTAIPQIGEESSSARAILENTIDGVAIAFPGTNNIACWLADLDVSLDQTPLGALHQGFHRAALCIRDRVIAVARSAQQPIVLCGHSEGADLALIMGGYLCVAGIPPRGIFAFEPARPTTDAKLAQILASYQVQQFLYANGNDVVPMVPRAIHAWQHTFPLRQIGRAALPVPNVEDHAMARVTDAIRAIVLQP